jgi:putative hydrolase of the HAD superfamily
VPAYRNYVFDLYGTLADIRTNEASPRLWRLVALWFSAHGAKYSAGELKKAYLSACAREQQKNPEPLYEIELRTVFRELFLQKGAEPDDRLVSEAALFFRLSSTEKLRLYPWVKPVLAALRESGAGIYLLSNAQACFTVPELAALGLNSAFDGVVLSSDAGIKKPHPEIMKLLIDRYSLDPRDCLMTGNDQRADIALAKDFQMDQLYIRTETSGEYDPCLRAKFELLDGDFSRLPVLLGLN